eukprot:840465-Rhodomonas_salina.1
MLSQGRETEDGSRVARARKDGKGEQAPRSTLSDTVRLPVGADVDRQVAESGGIRLGTTTRISAAAMHSFKPLLTWTASRYLTMMQRSRSRTYLAPADEEAESACVHRPRVSGRVAFVAVSLTRSHRQSH